MSIMKLLFFSLCLALTLCCTSIALSQKVMSTSAPIQIEADRMETSNEKNVVVFSGHVRANQSDLTIHADAMTVRYSGVEVQPSSSTDVANERLPRQIDKITANGNVKIVHEDWEVTGDTMDFNADVMTVRYSGAEVQSSSSTDVANERRPRQIDKITANGNVKIVQEDWEVTGDTMDFNADDRIVILTGNAKVDQNQNKVSGEKIIIYLDEGRSVVERGTVEGERVKAFIYPGSLENQDDKPPEGQ